MKTSEHGVDVKEAKPEKVSRPDALVSAIIVATRDMKAEEVSQTVNGMAFLVLAVLAFIAYLAWPTGILDTPLAQLTLGSLFLAAVSIATTLAVIFGTWWCFLQRNSS